jgi:DNA topoisomerase I
VTNRNNRAGVSRAAGSLIDLSARIAQLYDDTQACAMAAGLTYVSDESPGLRRRRQGRGFSYRDSAGRAVSDEAVKARIVALAIPPAWRNVWICPDDNGHIVAVGEDERGRKQYIYHERWRTLRDLLNFYRLITFGEYLPVIRDHVAGQLRRRTLDRDRVRATMVRIIDASAIRIGNEEYAEENDSFGLTTLTRRHATVQGRTVRLTFPAKSGRSADIIIRDPAVARVVGDLLPRRARRLFTVDGTPVDAAEINALLDELTDGQVSAKDFRTWHGTHTAFSYLEGHLDSTADPDRVVLDAIDAAAAALGNTRAVARAHYVHPQVLGAFTDGTFGEHLTASAARRPRLLAGSERRLLAFLRVTLESDLDAATVGLGGRRRPPATTGAVS